MRNLSKFLSVLFIASIVLVGCREDDKKDDAIDDDTTVIEGVEVDKDAKVEINKQ